LLFFFFPPLVFDSCLFDSAIRPGTPSDPQSPRVFFRPKSVRLPCKHRIRSFFFFRVWWPRPSPFSCPPVILPAERHRILVFFPLLSLRGFSPFLLTSEKRIDRFFSRPASFPLSPIRVRSPLVFDLLTPISPPRYRPRDSDKRECLFFFEPRGFSSPFPRASSEFLFSFPP